MSLDEFIDVPKQAELYSITAEEKNKTESRPQETLSTVHCTSDTNNTRMSFLISFTNGK